MNIRQTPQKLRRVVGSALAVIAAVLTLLAWPTAPQFTDTGDVLPPAACTVDADGRWSNVWWRRGAGDACAAHESWSSVDAAMAGYADRPEAAVAVFEVVWSGPTRGFSWYRESAADAIRTGSRPHVAACAVASTRDLMAHVYRTRSEVFAARDTIALAARVRTAVSGTTANRARSIVRDLIGATTGDDELLVFRNALATSANMPSLGACHLERP